MQLFILKPISAFKNVFEIFLFHLFQYCSFQIIFEREFNSKTVEITGCSKIKPTTESLWSWERSVGVFWDLSGANSLVRHHAQESATSNATLWRRRQTKARESDLRRSTWNAERSAVRCEARSRSQVFAPQSRRLSCVYLFLCVVLICTLLCVTKPAFGPWTTGAVPVEIEHALDDLHKG